MKKLISGSLLAFAMVAIIAASATDAHAYSPSISTSQAPINVSNNEGKPVCIWAAALALHDPTKAAQLLAQANKQKSTEGAH
jgi:hypothetical protein